MSTAKEVTDAFHELYYNARKQTWEDTRWLGVPVLKNPLDLWIYQEIISEIAPDVIVETGTFSGGSALYMAGICQQMGFGEVVTIDTNYDDKWPKSTKIRYLTGSSTDPDIFEMVKNFINHRTRVLVILDSDHSKEHVLNELKLYSTLVNIDSYIIVEDSNINGHPVRPEFGPGPMEAILEFLATNDQFRIDRNREKFFFTQNPKGFLKRIK